MAKALYVATNREIQRENVRMLTNDEHKLKPYHPEN